MVTLPKLIEPGVTPSVPLVTDVPLPVRATATEGSEASEATYKVALTVPDVAGVNDTDKFALLPAAKVYGKFIPLARYPTPLTVAPEMLRLLPPVLETVSVFVTVLPTFTLPRFMVDGELR